MVRIGVTGPMSSGKSTVARRFQEHGAGLVDGDALGWEVLRLPAVRAAIEAAFGPGVLDREGHVDRARLGRIVFRDAEAMIRLNRIVQPVLSLRVRELLDAPGAGVRVLDAAMLAAWGLEPELDGVVEVYAPPALRVRRLCAAHGFGEAEGRERVEGQRLPPLRGVRKHWRIENDADVAALLHHADRIWKEIEELERGGRGMAPA